MPTTRPLCRSESFVSDPAAEQFLTFVFERAGLSRDAYRPQALYRRLPASLRACRAASLSDLKRQIEDAPDRLSAVLDSLLIGVTSFFRDPRLFEELRSRFIPELVNTCEGEISVWAAGCSSGLELYSIALLFADLAALDRASFLGTDLRSSAVARAKDARFDAEMLLPVPDSYRRFFVKRGSQYTIVPEIRDRVRFEDADILVRREPEQFDLILCRNVVVYLQPGVARRFWKQLIDSVKPSGLLVTGRAERIDLDSVSRLSPCIYRKEENIS